MTPEGGSTVNGAHVQHSRLEQSLTKHASDYLSEEYNAYNA